MHPCETLAYGCLLHDVAKPVCIRQEGNRRITFYGHTEQGADDGRGDSQGSKRGRAVWERVAYLVRNHLRQVQAPQMRLSTLKRFSARRRHRRAARIGAHRRVVVQRRFTVLSILPRASLAQLKDEEIRPEPLLRGGDLIEMGFKPGPLFKEILRQVEDAQFGGELHSREDALAWMKNKFSH